MSPISPCATALLRLWGSPARFPDWPEPDPETKRSTEALLVDLLPLLPAGHRPHVGAGSDAGYCVELWWGDKALAFYVLLDTVDYIKSDEPEGGEWEVVEGRVPAVQLRGLVGWLFGEVAGRDVTWLSSNGLDPWDQDDGSSVVVAMPDPE